nr:acyltransferase [Methylovulum psychrotolerans]
MFKSYAYCIHLVTLVMDVLPAFLRAVLFRLLLKKLGKGGFIDYGTYIRYPFKVSIGDKVWINRSCAFYPGYLKEAEIIIGNHVSIGPETSIFAAAHDYHRLDLPDIGKTVRIGDHVWIGGRCIILPGVEIGEGAVVGGGSVVTKNVAPYTVVAGNPAKLINNRELHPSS